MNASDPSASDPANANAATMPPLAGRPASGGQFALLRQRRFAPFFWTQFLGAFNDNLFKTTLLTALTYDALRWTTIDTGLLNNLIPGLFILPFLLFSATAGQIAEKFDKARVARAVKLLEIAIMAVAAAGWFAHQLWLLVAAVAGMGLHSTMFGPMKYAYLPQHLAPAELTGGNGVVEMGTFVGILLGEVAGAVLSVHASTLPGIIAGATLAVAVAGWCASRAIPRSPAAAPDLKIRWNPFTETMRSIAFIRRDRPVLVAVLGNSWFWFYGAIVLAQFPNYAKDYLHGDRNVFVLLLAVFSLGIGAGSLLCERFSGRKVEIGLVPFGALGLSAFGIDLYFASLAYVNADSVGVAGFVGQHGSLRILLDCAMLGIFGGFYIVPLFATIQLRSDPRHVSRNIAAMNIVNAVFMVAAAGIAAALLNAGFTVPQLFMVTAIMNAVAAVYIFSLAPEFAMRFLAWLLGHTVRRVRVVGAQRIPETGAAVLVCNPVGPLDAIAIMAASPRPIRFAVDCGILDTPVLSWLFRTAAAIPMPSGRQDSRSAEQAFAEVGQALADGGLVCFFVRKGMPDGEFDRLAAGIGNILDRSPVPLIPLVLIGHALHVGQPLAPAQVTPELLRERLRQET